MAESILLAFFMQTNQWESLPLFTNRSCWELLTKIITLQPIQDILKCPFILDQKEAEMITFTVNEQERKIVDQFLLKLKVIILILKRNTSQILLIGKKKSFIKFSDKIERYFSYVGLAFCFVLLWGVVS